MEIPGRIATPTATLTLPAFGEIEPARLFAVDDLFAVAHDKFPISAGHTLIIARRPVARFQDLTSAEKARLLVWIDWTQQHLLSHLTPTPDAFNLGLNDGPAAGQTMPQLHFHVIPRYTGDVPDPRGGIRQVIPSKARYWSQLTQGTKPKPTENLSARAIRCLSTARIPAEKKAVLHALKTGALYPYSRPTLYGRKTHEEVCRWAGLDESFRPPIIPESTRPPVIENGLSARANHCLFRASIPAEKPAVMQALQTGALRPGKRPVNYGKQTHAELCRWVGMDASALPSL